MSSTFPPPPPVHQDARTVAAFKKLGKPKREDHCATCGRVVTARESAIAHLATGRVWCKRPSCRPVAS